jgi:hypothetical protein
MESVQISRQRVDGADVVLALKQAGEEIWAVGIDGVYSGMAHQDDEPMGNAFDITWLTIVCIKLQEIKEGKKPQTRIKGSKNNIAALDETSLCHAASGARNPITELRPHKMSYLLSQVTALQDYR